MSTKKYRPVTPSLRTKITNAYAEVTTNVPEKSLLAPLSRSGGRNQKGEMTMRYIGGGHKKQYRIIDFKRNKFDIPATVKTIEYDPNRSAFIALVVYKDGEKRYVIAPEGLKVGQEIVSGQSVAPEVGNTLPLGNMPLGSIVHNIELQPGRGAVICRSAGAYAQLNGKDGKYAIIKLPSGEARMILGTCLATIGTVSNSDHSLMVGGKAGASRWKGRRPRTRPVAMNPVDHPMGGGEGRSSGGHPRSRKGKISKGLKTRDKNKASSKYIISRKSK
ncbi:MAG TPA: 50S ribosomal protein L2 [Chitinophagales bacterium]|nr:50S ribosomal protein L2 [Chitinophagales bacterium]